MDGLLRTGALAAALLAAATGLARAQESDADARDIGPASANVTIFPVVQNAESCVYDPGHGQILAVNRALPPREKPDDAFVSVIGRDGTVTTRVWSGSGAKPPVLNQPYGSAVANGTLYVADRKGGTSKQDPTTAVLRAFDLETGAAKAEVDVDSPGLNDIAVAADGTVYATQTSAGGQKDNPDPATFKVFAITAGGAVSTLLTGAPLNLPNGIEIDGDGNIVVVNTGDDAVLTFSREGALLKTEHAAQPGSDGLVIMPDGTKYVDSILNGGVSRIAPGKPAELIATGIKGAASMCFDPGANQLVIPMGQNNALAVVPLD